MYKKKYKTLFAVKMMTIVCILALVAHIPVQARVTFEDSKKSSHYEDILTLLNKGIIKGVGNNRFEPDRSITYAETMQMLVDFYDLSLAKFTFIKAPQATDYYRNADNRSWYADAMTVSSVNGLGVDNFIFPLDEINRETFYYLLITGLEFKYQLPKLKMLPTKITDEEEIKSEYQGAIQHALVYGAGELDKDNNFNPKGKISRGEAASAFARIMEYLENGSYLESVEENYQGILNAKMEDGYVSLSFDLYNISGKDQTIVYSSGKKYDYMVYDENNQMIYQWSKDKEFTMALISQDIEDRSYVRYETTWDLKDDKGERVPKGHYSIVFSSGFKSGGKAETIAGKEMIEIKD